MADPKATKAAAEKAAQEGVDPGTLEGSGKDGTVTKQDVEEAVAAEAPPEEKKVKLVLNANSTVGGARGPDGVLYENGQDVDKTHFDQVLAGAKDMEGKVMFSSEDVDGGEA